MKAYKNPMIEILLFDEEDTVCASQNATYSERQLNEYMFGTFKEGTSVTSVDIRSVEVKAE